MSRIDDDNMARYTPDAMKQLVILIGESAMLYDFRDLCNTIYCDLVAGEYEDVSFESDLMTLITDITDIIDEACEE